MKKYINIVSIVTFILLISSCSEEITKEISAENKAIEEISKITNDFLASLEGKIPSPNSKAFEPNDFIPDIEAGLEEYMKNGDVGQAVSVGIAASQKATSGQVCPANGNGGNPIGSVINAANPLDYAGRYHAEVLEDALIIHRNQIYPNGVFNFTNAINFTYNYLASNNIYVNSTNAMTESEFNAFYANMISLLQNNDYKMSKVVRIYENEGRISSTERQILEMYFLAQESSNTLNGYIQYSIQTENSILNSNLSSKSKDLLLFTMATARHDINFWNPY